MKKIFPLLLPCLFICFVATAQKKKQSFDALPAGMRDPKLEAQLLKSIQKYTAGSQETYSKVKITEEGWTIERNELTGIILDRTISAYGLADWHDGICTYVSFDFKEEYIGSGFSLPICVNEGSSTGCECETSNPATTTSSTNEKQDNTTSTTTASGTLSAPDKVKDGPFEQKNSNGEITTSGQYDKGKKTGKWTYYNKGAVTREEEYLDGKLNGKKSAYSSGGNKEYEENYANGKKEGVRTDYDRAGKIDKVQNYKDNMLDGAFKKYTNGKLTQGGNYIKGKKDGQWKTYDESGKVTKTEVFKDGVLVQ